MPIESHIFIIYFLLAFLFLGLLYSIVLNRVLRSALNEVIREVTTLKSIEEQARSTLPQTQFKL